MILKVISLNIRHADDINGNTRKERMPRIKKVFAPIDADIINFQEYTPGWDVLRGELLGDEYDYYLQFRSEETNPEAAFISWKKNKFECLKKGTFWFSETPEVMSKSDGWDDIFDCYRICSYVILKEKQTGKAFTVMNTHFGFGDYGQVKSAKLIWEYSKKISDNPTLITGDFNTNPETPAYNEMIKYFSDVNMQTAKDMGRTFHGYGKSTKNSIIDYCFIDDKIKPIKSKRLDTLVDGKYLSDHYPIYFELEI